MPHFLTRIDPAKTAILVVDMTNDFIAPGASLCCAMGTRFASALGVFLDQCRTEGMKIIYTSQEYRSDKKDMGKTSRLLHTGTGGLVSGTRGVEIFPACAPKNNEPIVRKHFYSAFVQTDLDILLRCSGIDTVCITGVCTDVCCFATARDAFFHGYDVAFLSDLTGTNAFADIGYGAFTAEEHHVMALNNIWDCNGDVMTSGDFLSRVIK